MSEVRKLFSSNLPASLRVFSHLHCLVQSKRPVRDLALEFSWCVKAIAPRSELRLKSHTFSPATGVRSHGHLIVERQNVMVPYGASEETKRLTLAESKAHTVRLSDLTALSRDSDILLKGRSNIFSLIIRNRTIINSGRSTKPMKTNAVDKL